MATGPEHYREAERLVAMCVDSDGNPPSNSAPELDGYLRLAHIHATLATAAASAMPTISHYMGIVDPNSYGDDQQITEWARVIGWTRRPEAEVEEELYR